MDGSSANASPSLPPLVIHNTTDLDDLKVKLKEIIKSGPLYQLEVLSCFKSLLKSTDQEIVALTVQAVAELVKCEEKRKTLSQEDIIEPILRLINEDVTTERLDLIKHCCRAIGNLCCDNDIARTLVDKCNGVKCLKHVIGNSEVNKSALRLVACKALLNYAIGGQVYCDSIVKEDLIPLLHKIINVDVEIPEIDDESVITVLLLLIVIDDNQSEFLLEREVLLTIIDLLRETTNIKVSELCLELLHSQAEHDSVKNVLAKEGGIELVCSRLEILVSTHEAGAIEADEEDVENLIKQACDLVILVLTGDESMHMLYKQGVGEVYHTTVRWLSHSHQHIMCAGILAMGNFARQDDHCAQMMENDIFDKLLDIFVTYHGFAVRLQNQPDEKFPIEAAVISKVEHAVLSSLRNLLVPPGNKRAAAAAGRAAAALLPALPTVHEPNVAFKLLAAVRMLLDGHEGVARALCSAAGALEAVARWGRGAGAAGALAAAAGEAPRLLAWTTRQCRGAGPRARLLEVEGCISSLVNMLVSSHTVMQNEAILALTLLAIESVADRSAPPPEPAPPEPAPHFDLEATFADRLVAAEIGKHVAVLIDGNCAKMPVEVAENLLAFLDITSKKNKIAADYKEAKVHMSLQKFVNARQNFSEDLKACAKSVVAAIDSSQEEQDTLEYGCPKK